MHHKLSGRFALDLACPDAHEVARSLTPPSLRNRNSLRGVADMPHLQGKAVLSFFWILAVISPDVSTRGSTQIPAPRLERNTHMQRTFLALAVSMVLAAFTGCAATAATRAVAAICGPAPATRDKAAATADKALARTAVQLRPARLLARLRLRQRSRRRRSASRSRRPW